MLKFIKWTGLGFIGLLSLAGITYVAGPTPEFDKVNTDPIHFAFDITKVDSFIAATNGAEATLKADNGSQVYWVDSSQQQTPYCLLFLHGFTGTHHEANPLHKAFGERYGMNTYLHRIIDHGITDKDAFSDLTPETLLNSAKEGIAIAKKLGKKVVIMSCSTGGTYAAYLAQNDPSISHLIYLSPNIAVHGPTAMLAIGPWGQKLIEMTFGGTHRSVRQSPEAAKYWQTRYHSDGIIALLALIDQTMVPEVFQNLNQPTFIGCYYRDEEHQDFVVSVEAMRTFYDQISTPEKDKVFKAFPNANNHVIGSRIKADAVEEVEEAVFAFGDRYFEPVSLN